MCCRLPLTLPDRSAHNSTVTKTRFERSGSPKGLSRWLLRAPIGLYRVGLGFLMGKRLLMIEHVGRRSGEIRRTILEVVSNDDGAVYVAAAWGSKAQWLSNVRANPHVTVYLGSRRFDSTAVVVPVSEARLVMDRYAGKHPRAFEALAWMMLDEPGETAEQRVERVAEAVPTVRFDKPQ